MSAATIKRASGPKRKTRGNGGKKLRRSSRFDRMVARLPITDEQLQKATTALVMLGIAVLLGVTAVLAGIPQMVGSEFARVVANMGFEVKKVEVTGIERMNELDVYTIALGAHERSMASVDLAGLRQNLLKLGYVKDARITRRLPDTLVVDIVEREPSAIWQNDGKLALVDDHGTVLQPVDLGAMPDLPLVIGPHANGEASAFEKLMSAAPALKPMVAAATWVGNRRWDIRFQSGETLQLPEGDAPAAAALVNFARMDGVNRLLGRGIVRFDMRDPSKFVLRLPENRSVAKVAGDHPVADLSDGDGEG